MWNKVELEYFCLLFFTSYIIIFYSDFFLFRISIDNLKHNFYIRFTIYGKYLYWAQHKRRHRKLGNLVLRHSVLIKTLFSPLLAKFLGHCLLWQWRNSTPPLASLTKRENENMKCFIISYFPWMGFEPTTFRVYNRTFEEIKKERKWRN